MQEPGLKFTAVLGAEQMGLQESMAGMLVKVLQGSQQPRYNSST